MQGFLGGVEREETIEAVGKSCFDDLLSRSFQHSGENKSLFVMHDLIHVWHDSHPEILV